MATVSEGLPYIKTRMMSDLVMMKVFSVLKSRTRTAGFSGVIIVDSSSTGVEMSANGNAGCIIASTGFHLMSGLRTNSLYRPIGSISDLPKVYRRPLLRPWRPPPDAF